MHMLKISPLLLASFACQYPVGHAQMLSAADYARIRGANYVPSYASTSVGIWKDFDAAVVSRELGYAQRIGLNSVRMFLQYVVYEQNPAQFLDRVEQFVRLADQRGLRTMLVLFDSCFGDEPAMEKAYQRLWVNNPGYSRTQEENWPRLEKYVSDVVKRFKGDRRLQIWDIMNEPEADFNHVTRAERRHIVEFTRHFARFVKKLDPSHPVTIGHASVELIPHAMDVVDVISVHSYLPVGKWLESDLDIALGYGRRTGKPVIVTEFGNPSSGHRYEAGLDVIERKGLGFYLWELMIGKIMFNDQQGLFYPDGEVRDLVPIARLLGFKVKGGGIPLKPTPPRMAQDIAIIEDPSRWEPLLRAAEAAPRTAQGIQKDLPVLANLARFQLRPAPEATEVFELSLSIPHLFRLKRDQEAITLYEEFLTLARKAIRK